MCVYCMCVCVCVCAYSVGKLPSTEPNLMHDQYYSTVQYSCSSCSQIYMYVHLYLLYDMGLC